MGHSSALITVAMLSTYLSEEHRDYLDLLVPFVLTILPKESGVLVNKDEIIDALNAEYGFTEFYTNVLNKILDKCCRKGYVKKAQHNYYVKNVYDVAQFSNRKNAIKKSNDLVISALSSYLKEHTKIKEINDEIVKENFLCFLEQYGLAICNNLIDLKSLTNRDYINYHIARFILHENDLSSEIFSSILEIVKGFFVYKSIYYFNTNKKKDLASKLNNTQVFFDTRLLINALGYNTEEDGRSTIELINLIRKSGGEVKAFKHVKDEVAGILTKYACDINTHSTMNLAYLDINGYKKDDVLRLRDSLEINLHKININIVDTPSRDFYDHEKAEEKGFIDVLNLKSILETKLNYNSLNGNRIENDVASIEAISILRQNKRSAGIEDCKAIFVTQNNIILQTVNELFAERFSKNEISFTIHETDLTALLWLRSFNRHSNMPYFKLIENAYAACAPSDGLLYTFRKKIDLLEKEGIITDEEALIMRTQRSIRDDLVEVTENNNKNLTNEAVLKVKEHYISTITKDKDELIKKQADKISEYEKNKERAIENVEKIALQKSNSYCKVIMYVIGGLIIVVFLICLAIVFISTFSGVSNNIGGIITATVMSIISGIGLIDTFLGRKKILSKILTEVKNKKFDDVYSKEVKRLNDTYMI